jgi:uncharacterized lipoprotein YddW (UPF0748 family)
MRPEAENMTTTSGSNRLSLHVLLGILLTIPVLGGATPPVTTAWLPVENSAAVALESSGAIVAFPCRFTAENDRCAWDGPVPPGFDPAGRLQLTLSCDKPELLRGVTLYLKSGEGWYAAPLPAPDSRAAPLSLGPAQFIPEGKPAGWHRIQAVRLAAWKKTPGACTLRLSGFSSIQDRVFVIQAEDSVPENERPFAEAFAKRLSGWLQAAGIGHVRIAEKEWIALPPQQTRFAILPYNPRPGPAFLKSLDAVVKKGGKLLSCYNASPALASLMGLRLAPYKAAPAPVYWSNFEFAPPVGPVGRVFQESPNLIPAYPDSPKASILAWWENAAGKRREEPAWLASPAGYWMTHTLELEDAARKTRVLLEWIGESAPEAWEQAGMAALAGMEARLSPPLWEEGRALAARKEWKKLVDLAASTQAALAFEKAALLPPAPASETSAVWAQPGAGLMPADWPKVASQLHQGGIRRVYLSAIAFGRSHAESELWSKSEMAGFVSDPFGRTLKEARAAGLSVHAWVTCFNVAHAPPARLKAWSLAGRLIQTPQGEIKWLSPAHPENRELLLESLAELALRYPVDGLHLDYVRYPDEGLDISPAARKGFESETGKTAAHWPQDVLPGGARHEEYRQYLVGTLNQFVQAAHARLRAVRTNLTLTAAVFPAYPYCRDGVLQDWQSWLEKGSVDAVCPMSYTANPAEFNAFLEAYKAMPGWGTRIYPGIGVASDTFPLPSLTVLDQVKMVREAGGAGVVFFLANREFLRDALPVLQTALD